jgi:hypothetical protein
MKFVLTWDGKINVDFIIYEHRQLGIDLITGRKGCSVYVQCNPLQPGSHTHIIVSTRGEGIKGLHISELN